MWFRNRYEVIGTAIVGSMVALYVLGALGVLGYVLYREKGVIGLGITSFVVLFITGLVLLVYGISRDD